MSQQNCTSCGTVFYSQYLTLKCNVCKQTEAMEKQHRLNRQQARELDEANAEINARNAHNLLQAEYARIAAINHQTRAIEDSVISPKEAYSRGYNYIDTEWLRGNPCNLILQINKYGALNGIYDPPYVIPVLGDNFFKGLSTKISSYNKNAFESMKKSAYYAGKEHVNGTLAANFYLNTDVTIKGREIPTLTFRSNISSSIDEDTGELNFTWDPPFGVDALDQRYAKGVNEEAEKLNTDELKQHRLENDVVEIKAHRKKINRETLTANMLRYIYPNLILSFLILAPYIVWHVTTGWVTFFSLIGIFSAAWLLFYLYVEWHQLMDQRGYLD